MESDAISEFANGAWVLTAFVFSAAISHWILATAATIVVLCLAANIWMIIKMYGSVGKAYEEDGLKKCLFMLFLGVFWAIAAFIRLLSPEDGEEDEA